MINYEMISKEKAVEAAEKYITAKKRVNSHLEKENVQYKENATLNYGLFDGEVRNLWTVSYDIKGYDTPIAHFIEIDADTGEVLYTLSPHGYVEDWE